MDLGKEGYANVQLIIAAGNLSARAFKGPFIEA
jgi:hypothetical protein